MRRCSIVLASSLFLPLSLLPSCKSESKKDAGKSEAPGSDATTPSEFKRGRDDAWVFRSVLDKKPRMLTVALSEKFWIAYDLQRGSIYRAWRDGVELTGAVYTKVHGPQPISKGPSYLVDESEDSPWLVFVGGDKQVAEYRYLGHSFKDEHVVLKHELSTASGETLVLEEQPEVLKSDDGPVLERRYKLVQGSESAKVSIAQVYDSLGSDSSIEVEGGDWVVEKKCESIAESGSAFAARGRLVVGHGQETVLRASFGTEPVIARDGVTEDNTSQHPGEALIAKNDCKNCHNKDQKTVGPSYKAIAEKYPNKGMIARNLAKKVIQGGKGVWSKQAAMTPHPTLAYQDALTMVEYIMSLDGEKPEENTVEQENYSVTAGTGKDHGLVANVYAYGDNNLSDFPEITKEDVPAYSSVIEAINAKNDDFAPLQKNFYARIEGQLEVPKDNNYVFRLTSDDGSRLYLDDKLIIDHGGFHSATPKDGELELKAGKHKIRVDYFQGHVDQQLSLRWATADDESFKVIEPKYFSYDKDLLKKAKPVEPVATTERNLPGDQAPLLGVHPSFDLTQARPKDFKPKVGGMAFLEPGKLLVSTWDAEGAVYLLDGVDKDDPESIDVTKIATGLAEPLGLTVADSEIYVVQKHELTQLVDHDGDHIIDEYKVAASGWPVSANFHEFTFGLASKGEDVFGAFAIAILPGGASAAQVPNRGTAFKFNRKTRDLEYIAHGLRTPNGVGLGIDDEIFIADNQGDWLPSSKILHVQPGAFYGSRAVDPEGAAKLEETPPVVWLPQDEIGNSPSTPLVMNVGPYKDQMIYGEVTHGGIKRVSIQKVGDTYQGCVFRFTQGLEAGVNRMAWGPDGALYVGGVGSNGNWQHYGKLHHGLQRLKYNEKTAFEILSVKPFGTEDSGGLEVEFTEPLAQGNGWEAKDYEVDQWRYVPTENYGGPKVDLETLAVSRVEVSEDRKKVWLAVDGMKEKHVVHLRIARHETSEKGQELWNGESWCTMNVLPGQSGPAIEHEFSGKAPFQRRANTLTPIEKEQGWRLLFDGRSTKGWHSYNKDRAGSDWKARGGELTLSGTKEEGAWQFKNGKDLVSDEEFENFELQLEWKISEGGNSGIMYWVVEDEKYDYPWMTGVEMQVLDNGAHADAKHEKHRAGDLYDMRACSFVAANPPGEWNRVLIRIKDGHVEHWLNGHKVVEYQHGGDEWKELLEGSKFKTWEGFAKVTKGKISLQDHGDPVSYRNIKVRELK